LLWGQLLRGLSHVKKWQIVEEQNARVQLAQKEIIIVKNQQEQQQKHMENVLVSKKRNIK
jgi:hypothetical protein